MYVVKAACSQKAIPIKSFCHLDIEKGDGKKTRPADGKHELFTRVPRKGGQGLWGSEGGPLDCLRPHGLASMRNVLFLRTRVGGAKHGLGY